MVTSNNTPATVTRQVGKMTLTVTGDREIELRRVFDAPRRLVWEAFTKPEHVRQWWGCDGSSILVCEIDLRPGGAWHIVMRMPDGSNHPVPRGISRDRARRAFDLHRVLRRSPNWQPRMANHRDI